LFCCFVVLFWFGFCFVLFCFLLLALEQSDGLMKMQKSLADLPEDVLLKIFSLLDVKMLGRLAKMSKYLQVVASMDQVWRSHCLEFKLDPHAAILLRSLVLFNIMPACLPACLPGLYHLGGKLIILKSPEFQLILP
jgi:hypothetical protein